MQKKGRPTPSRKEAEAANKARAKVPRTRKEMAAAQKLQRSESSTQMRQAMRNGDDRFLPARDKGPVRRFIRDYVDSRFSFIELLIPLMLVVLILGFTGNPTVTTYANLAMLSVFARLGIGEADAYRERVKRGDAFGHLPTMQGYLWGRAGLSEPDAVALSAHTFSTGLLGAGIRLGCLSHIDAQQILLRARSCKACATRRRRRSSRLRDRSRGRVRQPTV